jgi:hypothetical protein
MVSKFIYTILQLKRQAKISVFLAPIFAQHINCLFRKYNYNNRN